MEYVDLHKQAIHLVELQQWHDFYYPSELSHPHYPTVAQWYRLAKKTLHRHYDAEGVRVSASLDRAPDLPFMLALTSCASIILSSVAWRSNTHIDIIQDRQTLKETYGTTLPPGRDTIEEWVSRMDDVLFWDYKTGDAKQWSENTIANIVAKMIEVEQKHPTLIDQSIRIIEDLRLKPERPHPAARVQQRMQGGHIIHYDMAA